MAQNGKVNPGVVPLKFGWKKNRGSKPEPPPVRDRIPTSKDSKDLFSCSPINIVFWLGVLTYAAAMPAIYFAVSIPSQPYWLSLASAFLTAFLFMFFLLLYVFAFAGPHAAFPCPEASATAANAVTPPLSLRPSPLLPTSVAAVA